MPSFSRTRTAASTARIRAMTHAPFVWISGACQAQTYFSTFPEYFFIC
jgi:hypothetical protein